MSNHERILRAIYNAVDEINEQLPKGKTLLDKSPETILFGKSGQLDSLGLVSLIVEVEQNIQDEFGAEITLADERAMSQEHSPFKSVRALSDYVALLLAEDETSSH